MHRTPLKDKTNSCPLAKDKKRTAKLETGNYDNLKGGRANINKAVEKKAVDESSNARVSILDDSSYEYLSAGEEEDNKTIFQTPKVFNTSRKVNLDSCSVNLFNETVLGSPRRINAISAADSKIEANKSVKNVNDLIPDMDLNIEKGKSTNNQKAENDCKVLNTVIETFNQVNPLITNSTKEDETNHVSTTVSEDPVKGPAHCSTPTPEDTKEGGVFLEISSVITELNELNESGNFVSTPALIKGKFHRFKDQQKSLNLVEGNCNHPAPFKCQDDCMLRNQNNASNDMSKNDIVTKDLSFSDSKIPLNLAFMEEKGNIGTPQTSFEIGKNPSNISVLAKFDSLMDRITEENSCVKRIPDEISNKGLTDNVLLTSPKNVTSGKNKLISTSREEDLLKDIHLLKESVSRLNEIIQEKNRAMENMISLADFNNAIEEKMCTIVELEAKIGELQKAVTSNDNELMKKEDVIKNLFSKIDKLEAEMNKVNQLYNECESSMINEMITLKKEKSFSEKKIEEFTKDLKEKETAYKDLLNEYENCGIANKRFKSNEGRLKASIKQSAELVKHMRDQYKALQEQVKVIEEARAQLEKQNKDQENEIAALGVTYKRLEMKTKGYELEINKNKDDLQQMVKICDDLVERIKPTSLKENKSS